MSYELDMTQYLDLFLQEAREQLEILEQETLKLEADPNMDRLQVIFRSAHTLKGSARAMGFQKFAELTHEMENVLDNLRNGALQVNSAIADALLGCLDTLTQMTESISEGKGDAVECAALVAKLSGFVGNESSTPRIAPLEASEGAGPNFTTNLDPDTMSMLRAAAEEGTIWHGKFRLSADCAMKYVRAFMALTEIQKTGEILACYPDAESMEEEKFDRDFEFAFTTTDSIEILNERLAVISEIEWYVVDQLTTGSGSAPIADEEVAKHGDEGTEISEVTDLPAQSGPSADSGQAAAPTAAQGKRAADSGQTVRVDVTRLDALMNLVGELVIDRTRIAQIGAELSQKYEDENIDALGETVGHIHRITSDLQDQIMKARMMPIETVFNRFPRVVRDLAQKLGKDIKLEIEGGDTELDRSVIEVIGDPLLHILRNSIDHGIEMPDERQGTGKPSQGTVRLSARHRENHIIIEITDDGKGIDVERVKAKAIERGLVSKDAAERLSDREALQFIFASGLSTAQEVSEVSGRGVGMDIVRSNLQKLGGIIDMESTVGEGTRFSLRLPLTLAIIRGLLVNVSETVYVIPLGSVIETLLVSKKEIESVNKREVIVIRGMTTPLVHLRDVFNLAVEPSKSGSGSQLYVVIVGLAEQRVGLVVDRLIGEREVVIKSLSRFCGEIAGLSGATILGDGNVALIMDVNGIVAKRAAA